MALKFTMRLLIFASFCCFLLKTAHAACDALCTTPKGVCGPDATTCYCNVGYYGTECADGASTNLCASGPAACASGEVCVVGGTCSTDCAAAACINGGTCVTTGAGTPTRVCLCTTDYAGAKCDECASDVGCNSKGTCNTGTGVCTCTANYAGTHCDECKTDIGCTSKGTCDATAGTCTCDSSNVGTYCQHACPAECPTSCTLKADGTGAECLVQDSGAVMVMTSLATIVMAVLGPFL